RSAQNVFELGYVHARRRLLPARVDLLDRRHEQHVDVERFEKLSIFFGCAWIRCEILVRPELQRVDEDTDDDSIGALTRGRHETPVARVEITHRRHERDTLACIAPGTNEST